MYTLPTCTPRISTDVSFSNCKTSEPRHALDSVAVQSYDLIVIGSGPAGQRAAIQGAKSGKRVAVIERREVVGGACINTGTIPSKTMREAVLHLSGYSTRASTASTTA